MEHPIKIGMIWGPPIICGTIHLRKTSGTVILTGKFFSAKVSHSPLDPTLLATASADRWLGWVVTLVVTLGDVGSW